MADDAQARKLATIVALDVAGYSARAEADEARTTTEVAALRKVIEGIASRHGGRIFNTAGDGFMLEFGSSLAAVEAAFELAETCEPKVRVGVHLGDVAVQPNGDLLGHGVNVAARLMAQSQPGAALVSADVRRTIRGPLAARMQSHGLLKLDKMTETIEAFALAAAAPGIVAAQSKAAEPLLAVLPFDNLSNDPEMQFFSDGVSEEILHTVARARGLRVIGRTSSFQFRGHDKSVRKVADELRATHVLDGSVRRSGNRVRVSAHLVEASSQTTLWSDHFDRELTDVLKLQDEIASATADALKASFFPNASAVQIDPQAYELLLRARSMLFQDGTDEQRQETALLLEQAVALAPEYAEAWARLAFVKALALRGDGDSGRQAAVATAERARMLDRNNALAYVALAALKPPYSDHGEKLQLTETALALAPNDAWVSVYRGNAHDNVGRNRAGLVYWNHAEQIEPLWPYLAGLHAFRILSTGDVEGAFGRLEQTSRRVPGSPVIWLFRQILLVNCGRYEEAERNSGAAVDLPPGIRRENTDGIEPYWTVPRLSRSEQDETLRAMLARSKSISLPIRYCQVAATLGHADLAFEQLFDALDSGRQLKSGRDNDRHSGRAFQAGILFMSTGRTLRRDVRFTRLCLRLGLVDYWRASGDWPDCVSEVPYDFKAECAKAAAERTRSA